MNTMTDFFTAFGFDEDDMASVKKKEKKAEGAAAPKEKKKPAGKAAKATEKAVKLALPVTIYGRSFTLTMPAGGKAETTLDEALGSAYRLGIAEVAHKGLSYAVIDENTVVVSYSGLSPSNERSLIERDVTFTEGRQTASYRAEDLREELCLDPDELCLKAVCRHHEQDGGADGRYSYDASSGTAMKCLDAVQEDKVPDKARVRIYGEIHEAGAGRKELCAEYLGEPPEGCRYGFYKESDDTYIACFVPPEGKKCSKSNRPFAALADETGKLAEEKVKLPVNIRFINTGDVFVLSPEEFGESRAAAEKIVKWVKENKYRSLNSRERRIDTFYTPEKNMLSLAAFSGTKGA